jgi:hypothetical protein
MGSSRGSRSAPSRRRAELLREYRELVAFGNRSAAVLDALPDEILRTTAQQRLLECPDVELVESRKGARVTERSGYSTGRSYSGVRVGPVYVGGSSGSRRGSTTVSYPAPDELTLIDRGVVSVTTRSISFVGSQFTRTTEFAKLAAIERRARQILIAPATATKVHILGFPSEEEAFLAEVFLFAGMEHPYRRLENVARSSAFAHPVAEGVQAAREMLAQEIAAKRDEIRELVVGMAHLQGEPVVPEPLPAPAPSLHALIQDDPIVPFVSGPAGRYAASSSRSAMVALGLAFFFGTLGADRFYLGYTAKGFLKFFTGGGLGYLWIRDLLLLLRDDLPDVDGLPLS